MRLILPLTLGVLACAASSLRTSMPEESDVGQILKEVHARHKDLMEGANADYIPALAKVDPGLFGIALVTAEGQLYTAGDVETEVSIQSISKVFTMAKVIEESGPEAIFDRIGVDATGMRFNSIVAVEMAHTLAGGPEMNALVNPGAIAATSLVRGESRDEIWSSLLEFYSQCAGRELAVDQEVFASEAATNQRNQAIGALMHAYGYIDEDPKRATDIYTEQCSVAVSARDLAVMAATLANAGRNPLTKKKVMSAENVPGVLSVMATAGLYDESGKWLFRTGLPGKSGVGGGLIAVSPGRFGIAVVSPPLDPAGNSVRGQRAIEDVVRALGANPYKVDPR